MGRLRGRQVAPAAAALALLLIALPIADACPSGLPRYPPADTGIVACRGATAAPNDPSAQVVAREWEARVARAEAILDATGVWLRVVLEPYYLDYFDYALHYAGYALRNGTRGPAMSAACAAGEYDDQVVFAAEASAATARWAADVRSCL